ncbi:MAG: Hsp20/alpha crystallin family protein [Geminicoccaceae bacterium]
MATMGPFGLGAGDPFRELRRLQAEMDRLVGGYGQRQEAGYPPLNLYAGRDGIAVVAELPGVEAADLEVHAHKDTLTIKGTRKAAAARPEAYHRRERVDGPFTRTIQLPFRVDPDKVEAQLDNGVLRLSLSRPEEEKPRRIQIQG